MNKERGEIFYTRIADIDTSWMKTFNSDMISGFEQNGVKVRVVPQRGTIQGHNESDVFAHKLRVLESFSQMTISDNDVLFVSCPLRCSLDQIAWATEVVQKKKPVIACYTLTGTFVEEEWIAVFTPWVSNLEKIWYEKSDLIFVPSEYFKKAMLEAGYEEGKIFIVGAPVNSREILSSGGSRDRNLVLFNHRLNADKKPRYFLRMVEDLSSQFPELRFSISTNLSEFDFWNSADDDIADDLKGTLLKFRALDIVFNRSRNQYFSLLNQAYLAPCFSTHETFGFSVAEAMAAGCLPIVPSRLTYPELVDGNEDLMYTSTDDPEKDYQAALKKIIYFIQNPSYGEQKSTMVRAYIDRFNPEIVTGKILSLINQHQKGI